MEEERLSKRDIKDMLENEAYRLAAAGREYSGGILVEFFENQKKERDFKGAYPGGK